MGIYGCSSMTGCFLQRWRKWFCGNLLSIDRDFMSMAKLSSKENFDFENLNGH